MAEATVGILRVVLASNTAQFNSGMDQASQKIGAFDRSTKAAAQSIARLVGDFNGAKVTAEATKMAAAIEKVGGASKLTETELSRVNRTLDAAIQKFRLMGQEVPPHIAKLSAEVKALDTASAKAAAPTGGLGSFSGALGMVGKLLPGLSVVGAVTAITGLARAALQASDEIVKFSARTGVSIDTIQRWKFVAGQTSTTIDAFANNAYKLGINVGNGTTKVRDAVNDLGLAYTTLKGLKPEQQFDVVMKALEGVESATERNRIGQALFGKQFAEIAVAVAEGYTKMKDGATVASDEQVRAAERAGDAIDKLKNKISALALRVFGDLAAEITETAAAVDTLNEAQNREFIAATKLGQGYQYLIQVERDRHKNIKDIHLATEGAAAATTDYIQRLAAVRAEVAGLTSAQRLQIDAALKLGGVSEELADQIGVSEEALRMYTAQGKESAKSTKELAAEKLKAAEAAKKFAESIKHAIAVLVPFRATIVDTATDVRGLGGDMSDLASGSLSEYGAATTKARKEALDWANANGAVLAPSIEAVGTASEDSEDKIMGLVDMIRTQLGPAIIGAFQGGGDVGKSIGGFLGNAIGTNIIGGIDDGGKFTSGLGKWLQGTFGKVFGGFAASVIPGLAAMLGGKLLGSLFGGNKEHMKVNDLRDAFTSAAGGIHELNVKAQAAGLTLDRLLKAKTVKEYEAAIRELNAAFAEQARILAENTEAANTLFDDIMDAGSEGIPAAYRPAIEQLIALGLLTDEQAEKLRGLGDSGALNIKKMDDALALFNGRAESLGPAYQQAKIDETSQKYVNAIDLMTKGGGSLDQVLHDAKEELSALAVESRKTGTTLPANMKPWLQTLIDQGKLLDENGQKITDLSGIKFGEEMKTEAEVAEEGWAKIIALIQALVEKITGPLTDAIEDIPTELDITARVTYEAGNRPDFDINDPNNAHTMPVPFASGTMGKLGSWFANFGKGTSARLHGSEAVLTPNQALPFSLQTLAGMLPSMPRILPDFDLGSLPGGGGGEKTINNYIMVPMPVEAVGDPYRMATEVYRQFPGALETDREGVTSAFEQLIENFQRTYSRG